MEEKMSLPSMHSAEPERTKNAVFKRRLVIAIAFLLCYFSAISILAQHPDLEWPTAPFTAHKKPAPKCGQVDPLRPAQTSKALAELEAYLASDHFRNASIARLSAAVQIPTESFDDMGPIGADERWDVFYDFAAYLRATFPLVHAHLRLDVVNVHGLVYTWPGSDAALKPTLLMAHQDVVPVPASTVSSWTHPPFAGHYDGKYVWGRGASDCKNSLIAILEAMELLVGAGFAPKRTVVLSSGFDEEISGGEGAGHLAPYLLERYGEDGVAVIVDEGAGVNTLWGTHFASPGVAEKGYIDVEIVVRYAP
jgi:Gly-Xaa carboxypeptidase